MKKTYFIYGKKMACLAVAIIGFTAVSARADYVLGNWQNSLAEGGWIDFGSGLPIGSPQPLDSSATYSLAPGVVPGFAQSLKITQKNEGVPSLALDMASVPGDMAAFFTNSVLSFQFSVPVATNTSGWNQIYTFALNATGYGFRNLVWTGGTGYSWTTTDVIGTDNNSGGMPNYYYGPATEVRSEIVTLNYAGLIPILEADGCGPSSGYVEIAFAPNTGGGAPDYLYMNNVVLSVPEPATGALILAGGAMALLRACRRIKTNA